MYRLSLDLFSVENEGVPTKQKGSGVLDGLCVSSHRERRLLLSASEKLIEILVKLDLQKNLFTTLGRDHYNSQVVVESASGSLLRHLEFL